MSRNFYVTHNTITILHILQDAGQPLTGSRIAELAGFSPRRAVYPVIARLVRGGLINSYWETKEDREAAGVKSNVPHSKRNSITEEGRMVLERYATGKPVESAIDGAIAHLKAFGLTEYVLAVQKLNEEYERLRAGIIDEELLEEKVGYIRYECPLNNCVWHYDMPSIVEPKKIVMPDAVTINECSNLSEMIEAVSAATVGATSKRVDLILYRHFREHPVEDFLIEINRLNTEVMARDKTIKGLLILRDEENSGD